MGHISTISLGRAWILLQLNMKVVIFTLLFALLASEAAAFSFFEFGMNLFGYPYKNECASNPCKDNQICKDLPNWLGISSTGYMCQCKGPWKGVNCDIKMEG